VPLQISMALLSIFTRVMRCSMATIDRWNGSNMSDSLRIRSKFRSVWSAFEQAELLHPRPKALAALVPGLE
jgi:hypothetical protein